MRAHFSPNSDSVLPDGKAHDPAHALDHAHAPARRLNLLLSYGGWREDAFSSVLPPILARPPQADPTESARTLREALHEGVFTVVDDPTGPHGMEHLLRALKSCVDRHFANHWNAA